MLIIDQMDALTMQNWDHVQVSYLSSKLGRSFNHDLDSSLCHISISSQRNLIMLIFHVSNLGTWMDSMFRLLFSKIAR